MKPPPTLLLPIIIVIFGMMRVLRELLEIAPNITFVSVVIVLGIMLFHQMIIVFLAENIFKKIHTECERVNPIYIITQASIIAYLIVCVFWIKDKIPTENVFTKPEINFLNFFLYINNFTSFFVIFIIGYSEESKYALNRTS